MPSSEDIRYDRLCRTANSEAYLLSLQDEPLGRVELHFTSSVVYGLLIVEREMPEEEILDLIEQIDEDLVWSADLPRDDFVVTVYQGREVGVYSDPTLDDDDLDEEENGNGERI
jgi:hypothetical protein